MVTNLWKNIKEDPHVMDTQIDTQVCNQVSVFHINRDQCSNSWGKY